MAGVKALVIGMGVLLVAGFAVLVATLIGRASGDGGAPISAELDLGPGERLADAALDGRRVLLRIEGPDGARVEVLDLKDGAVLGRITVAPASR